MLNKILWSFRALLLKPFFKNIGHMTYIGKPLFLKGTKKIHIGNKVRIFPGSRLETHEGGSIKIADNCSIGQNLHVISYKEELSIGSNSLFSSQCICYKYGS